LLIDRNDLASLDRRCFIAHVSKDAVVVT